MLGRILSAEPVRDPRVVGGPGGGGAGAGGEYLVAKTDPITHTTEEIGWFAVHINATDIACLGATPAWFLAVLLLPEDSASEASAERIFADIRRGCADIGVSLVGGHTEITFGLPRPMVAGAMLGEVGRERLVTPKGAKAGDALVLTKGVPLEAVAILARERRDDLVRAFGEERVEAASRLLYEPGISVVPAVRTAVSAGVVHAMHDPTEGGITTALVELATASGLGLEVYPDRIPVLEETHAVCDCLDLDPLGLIASGAADPQLRAALER
ncbi:MAG: AIR synthase related protein, partial [Nitrospinota bacterium]